MDLPLAVVTIAVVYTILCGLCPRQLVPWLSIPFVDSLEWQFGSEALHFQCTVEPVYHGTMANRTAHLLTLLLIDGVCWWLIVQYLFGWAGCAALMLVLAAQAVALAAVSLAPSSFLPTR